MVIYLDCTCPSYTILTGVHRLVAKLAANAKRSIGRAMPHMKPLLDERIAKINEHGLGESWEGKPVSIPSKIENAREFNMFT